MKTERVPFPQTHIPSQALNPRHQAGTSSARLPSLPHCAFPLPALSAAARRTEPVKPLKFPRNGRWRTQTIPGSGNGSLSLSRATYQLNSEVSPHRTVAAIRLLRIETGGAFADLLNNKGKKNGDNEMQYVERTLGFRTRDLDDRDLRLILRIAFYEIVKSDSPPHAAVNENVKLAKVSLRPGAGHMVNGILRKLVLLKENDTLTLLLPKLEGDERSQARALATHYSHPVWMVRRWMKHFGQDAAVKLMSWNNSHPSFSLRANRRKGFTRADLIKQLDILKVPHEVSLNIDDFVRIRTGMQMVLKSSLLNEGLCAVQDESAGLVVSVMDPQPGESILECCAAPGGKTLYMASLMKGRGMVSALDINKGRLRLLLETAISHNVDKVITTIHADLRIFAEKKKVKFDKVLLDAPCSGLGVLSKRADLRWNRKLEDMEQLKGLQDELLNAAAMLVKPGGILVYSTCSIDQEENEGRVTAFLIKHSDFCIDSVEKYVPSCFVTERGFYFSNPVHHSLDGAFAARLVRL